MDEAEYQGSLSVLRNQKSFTNKTSSKNKLRRSNHLSPDLKLTKKPRVPIVWFVFTEKIHSSAYQQVVEETTSSQDTDCGKEWGTSQAWKGNQSREAGKAELAKQQFQNQNLSSGSHQPRLSVSSYSLLIFHFLQLLFVVLSSLSLFSTQPPSDIHLLPPMMNCLHSYLETVHLIWWHCYHTDSKHQ